MNYVSGVKSDPPTDRKREKSMHKRQVESKEPEEEENRRRSFSCDDEGMMVKVLINLKELEEVSWLRS